MKTNVRFLLVLTLISLVAGLGWSVQGKSQGSVIIGTVVNAEDRKPVADVVVTAASPNLEGEQVVKTDEHGNYRIAALPPGVYTLRFEKKGFENFARSEIQLRLNRTIRVNVDLLPDSF